MCFCFGFHFSAQMKDVQAERRLADNATMVMVI
jgi:hypothetical protein